MADDRSPQQQPDITPSGAGEKLRDLLSKKADDLAPKRGDKNAKREDQRVFGDAARSEHTKQVVHGLVVWLLRVGAFCFYGVLVVRVLHFMLPERPHGWVPHCWLSDEQLQSIDKFFFSGALGAALAKYLKGAVSSEKKEPDSCDDSN